MRATLVYMNQGLAIFGFGIVVAALIMSSGSYNKATSEQNTRMPMNETAFSITSPAFDEGGAIPKKYTCDGENISPPLHIENAPKGTRTLALIMDDPDIPQEVKDANGIETFDHWVLYGIEPSITNIDEGAVYGAEGVNGAGKAAYTGPCPPPQYQPTTHRYFFKLYALSGSLQFIKAPTRAEVEAAMQSMIIGRAELMGTYDRTQ